MKSSVLAEDAVCIRRACARGLSELDLRRQLAGIPTPTTRRFVFVRRLTLRATPDRVRSAMAAALSQLAGAGQSEVLTFADLPAVAVACARAAISGGLGGGWHWRTLGLAATLGPGEAVAILLRLDPLQAGSVVAALAAQDLLAPVWRDLSESTALQLSALLAAAAGVGLPQWPSDGDQAIAGQTFAPAVESLLARAESAWAPALSAFPPHHEAVRTSAVLALMRWSPSELRSGSGAIWTALLARLSSTARRIDRAFSDASDAARSESAARPIQSPAHRFYTGPVTLPAVGTAGFFDPLVGAAQASSAPGDAASLQAQSPLDLSRLPASHLHGVLFETAWGGVLFLINSLQRLRAPELLASCGADAPSGWRLLHDVAVSLGMPLDEPLAGFLNDQDLGTVCPAKLRASVIAALEKLYAPDGPWPLPLAQSGRIHATETHIDLDLATSVVDVAVRKAGLDIDPGWTPWLGRVVHFHYPYLRAVHGESA